MIRSASRDGPTHQPIEHLAGLRSIPNLNVFGPCDEVETFEAWEIAVNSLKTPSVLAFQDKLPPLEKNIKLIYPQKVATYSKKLKNLLTLIASGSEVSIV